MQHPKARQGNVSRGKDRRGTRGKGLTIALSREAVGVRRDRRGLCLGPRACQIEVTLGLVGGVKQFGRDADAHPCGFSLVQQRLKIGGTLQPALEILRLDPCCMRRLGTGGLLQAAAQVARLGGKILGAVGGGMVALGQVGKAGVSSFCDLIGLRHCLYCLL